MSFILTATAVLMLASITLAFILQGGFSRRRRRAAGFWRRFWLRQMILLPLYVFVLLPGLMGCAGSRMVRTRGDESAYQGPILSAGKWQIQDRETLRHGPPSGELQAAIDIPNPDGPTLRGYFIPSQRPEPVATVLLVHGLFRSAMELEPVAAMFRELGAEVLLLNLRNHGGSETRPFTFGLHEAGDVLAGVAYLRQRPGGLRRPLILYGVSMGTVATARAAPQIPELAGLVLDAPMTDLRGTAHRLLGRIEWQGRSGLGLPAFYVDLVLFYLELASDFDTAAVRPIDQITALSPKVHSLFIGAGHDVRVPPAVVEAVYAAHPAAADHKQLWIEPEAAHGRVLQARPERYRAELTALLRRVLGR